VCQGAVWAGGLLGLCVPLAHPGSIGHLPGDGLGRELVGGPGSVGPMAGQGRAGEAGWRLRSYSIAGAGGEALEGWNGVLGRRLGRGSPGCGQGYQYPQGPDTVIV